MLHIKINLWFVILVLIFIAGVLAILADILIMVAFIRKGKRTAGRVMREKPVLEFYEEAKANPNYCCYEDMPPALKLFIVNLEDKNFWKHHGVDIIKTVQALFVNITKWSKHRGASTITQQLAKNMYFSFEKTIHRKVAEFFVARELEKKLTKQQILELYLNIVGFGEEQNGITCASRFYFETEPEQLSINQAVALICMMPSPVRYSPLNPKSDFAWGKRRALSLFAKRALIKDEDIDMFMEAGYKAALRNDITEQYEAEYRKICP